jgi:hypothetical protein
MDDLNSVCFMVESHLILLETFYFIHEEADVDRNFTPRVENAMEDCYGSPGPTFRFLE